MFGAYVLYARLLSQVKRVRPITYIASYPRSGNTFVRTLLANYLDDGGQMVTPKAVAFFGVGEKIEPLWQACTGQDWRQRTLETEWRARKAYLDGVRALPGEGPVFLKTHTLNGSIFDTPAFFFEPADRIVYVVRHPLDVLVSGAHFFETDIETMAGRLLASGAFNTTPAGHFEVVGAWVEHVGGWMTETRCPLLMVRYETLLATPDLELARILRFLDVFPEPARIERALRHSAFEAQQAAHAEEGFDQGPGRDPRHVFYREGKAGRWRRVLPPEVVDRTVEAIGPYMAAFGYERA